MEYWLEHPPAHVILAGVHLKKQPRRTKQIKVSDAAEDIHEFKSALGFSGIAGPLPAIYRDK